VLPPSAQSRHAILAGFLPVFGFTLLEFLVVLAIIAIGLGFLIPSLGIGGDRSAEAAARQLTADLDGARLTAMAERTRIRILFPTNNANFAAGSSNLDPTATPTPSTVIADGFVDSSGAFVKKGASLRYTIMVDPLTGAVSLK